MSIQNSKIEYLEKMRHSCAHLLAAAVLKLFPETKLGIGPAIDNGFYYDFEFKNPMSEGDLFKIEKEMKNIKKNWHAFERIEKSINEAKKIEKNQLYKLDLIEEFSKISNKVSFYKSGDFIDLCKGGHIENPQDIGPFKLLTIAGAYWRGSENNPMLTRIYGTCFPTQKELDEHISILEEAKKRDHRKIGKELDLFSFHEEAPGFVFWHPKGMAIRSALSKPYEEMHRKAGYKPVSTPILLSEELWRKSGHWDNYKDKMYFTKVDNRTFAIKPMNCPGVSLIYRERPRSYKDLPLRLAESGEVHRHELSGTLIGLFRVRAFRQDDAHIFVREDQIENEVKEIVELTMNFYKMMGFNDADIELSTRPEKSMGSKTIWDKAESILKKVLDQMHIKYKINEGEGSFYGPKIDFHIKDHLLRSWQCGTIQLDFLMPERFDLEYIDKDGSGKRPVMIHRTIVGSIQRFIGILIEHYAGAFPLWLSPIQVVILPIADRHNEKAKKIREKLFMEGIRVKIDQRRETLQLKIREATLQKVPYMGIIGDKEAEIGAVSVRTRNGKNLGQMGVLGFLNLLKEEIDKKT